VSASLDPFAADVAAVQSIAAVPTILDMVCSTTGMGFAAVARVTGDRWIACGVRDTINFGLKPGGELAVETTICSEIRDSGQAVVIDHVAQDEAFASHPCPAMYGFQSYISVPINLPDGRFFGTLCAIDPRPAKLNTPGTIGMFKLFAELIAFHLDAHERLGASAERLKIELHNAQLREQFIAVLGHDLRNPLAAVEAGATLLQKAPLDTRSTQIVRQIKGSTNRMAALIDNVLDFARGRMGGGVPVVRAPCRLETVLEQVVGELRAGHRDRVITTEFTLEGEVDCDPARVGQLLSNLLGNAVAHGSAEAPIVVTAHNTPDELVISVRNGGTPIPAAALERLFEPFERGAVNPRAGGLGLGLYIASEIARAHGGVLSASSTSEMTEFTFRMPTSPGACPGVQGS
jgi:signal transduction histidine kinase